MGSTCYCGARLDRRAGLGGAIAHLRDPGHPDPAVARAIAAFFEGSAEREAREDAHARGEE